MHATSPRARRRPGEPRKASVPQAATLTHDADNLFVALGARGLNRDLTIIARASNDKNGKKTIAAGATRVLNPYLNGGRLMARQLLHPSVTEFIDAITGERGGIGAEPGLSLEEVQLQPGSNLAGVMLRDAPIRKNLDVIVVGVRRADRTFLFNPTPELAPGAGDVLIVLGAPENLRRLETLAEGGPGADQAVE